MRERDRQIELSSRFLRIDLRSHNNDPTLRNVSQLFFFPLIPSNWLTRRSSLEPVFRTAVARLLSAFPPFAVRARSVAPSVTRESVSRISRGVGRLGEDYALICIVIGTTGVEYTSITYRVRGAEDNGVNWQHTQIEWQYPGGDRSHQVTLPAACYQRSFRPLRPRK